MKKKEAWKHLKKLWKKMHQHFKEFTRSEDPEALHKFRVQVKKVRSFLTLLERDKKNKSLLKTFKPVKKLFKSAGVIRDAFLHQQQAKKHNIQHAPFYEEHYKLQREETEKLLGKKRKHLKKIKRVKKKLHNNLHSISAEEIKTFYRNQLNNTKRLLSKHDFSEQLHDGRKMLKHLLYNEDVVQDGIAKDLNINFTYVDDLQKVLGRWHDNKLALDFFLHKELDKDAASMKQKNEELEKAITEKATGFAQKINASSSS